jgi:hypothetical protein
MQQEENSILLVPPMLAIGVVDTIGAAIRENLKGHLDLLYPYLYLGDQLKNCAITVSGGQIEIAPPFLPSGSTFPFSQENMRRVYLSATLRTQSEFARAFGRKPGKIIAPETDAGNGERCILFGQSVPDIDTGPKLAAAIREKHKLVISCRNYSDAKVWEGVATILKREGFSAELEKFRKADEGAVVLVARVDGIDLPDEACRVMLIDNLPSGYSQLERFQIEYCAMTSLAATKLASRITQVLGRINRGRKDYGVFILRGRPLNNWLSDQENTALLPELLQKQLLLGEAVSFNMLRNKDYNAILSILNDVMDRNPEWISTYGDRITNAELPSSAKASAEEKDALLTTAAVSEAQAIQAAWQHDYGQAAAALAETADKAAIADARLGGWHNLWLGWFYQLAGDGGAAASEYQRARSRLGGVVYVPAQAEPQTIGGKKVSLRAIRLFDLLAEEHSSRFDRELAILVKRFEPLGNATASAAQHEEATRALGEALGFTASRPDNVHRTGPDVLWVDDEARTCLLFELKTLQDGSKPIAKKAVGQGHDHLQWVKDNHGKLQIVGLGFIADTTDCHQDANPSADMWVGPLCGLHQLAQDLITVIKTIRALVPVERLVRMQAYVEDDAHSLTGLLERICPVRLNGQTG